MAKVYGAADGSLLRVLISPGELAAYPNPPAGTASMIDFDPDTNTALATALHVEWNSFSMPGGVLTRNGQPVPIAAAGQDYGDRNQAQAILAALAAGTATNAQVQQALRFVLRRLYQQGLV